MRGFLLPGILPGSKTFAGHPPMTAGSWAAWPPIVLFECGIHVDWFKGNFEAYEEDKKRGLGVESLIPHRIKFQNSGGRLVLVVRRGVTMP